MITKKLSDARKLLKKIRGHTLVFGELIQSLRKCDNLSQNDLAKKLKMSRAHLCDIEKGRRMISPERAAQFARVMGYSVEQFIALAIETQLRQAGFNFQVELIAA